MARENALWLSVPLLLLVLCIQILASVCTTSPTFDEPYHIVRSYVYLKTGDSALLAQGGHPPLANMLSVSPLLLRSDIVLPLHQPGWPDVGSFKDLFRVADEFFWRLGNDAEGIVLWARLPMLLLSALLAGLVFRWAREWNDLLARQPASSSGTLPVRQPSPPYRARGSVRDKWYSAGLLALLLYTFDPNIIAHSSIVTTDLGATFFIFASIYCLWRFCQRPSWGKLILTGVAFGLAQATKFSALFLAPIFLVLLGIWATSTAGSVSPFALPAQRWFVRRPRLQSICLVLGLCFAIFVIGFTVLWAVYGFETSPLLPHKDSHPLLDRFLPGNDPTIKRLAYALAENCPLPAPAYFADLAWLRRYAHAGHPSFLIGNHAVKGWWFYFPVAFLIKTPIPLLILLAVAIYLSLKHRAQLKWECFLLVPMTVFFASSMFSSIDIGYRNILPVLPFAFVYVSKVATRVTVRLSRIVLVFLCAWYVLGTVALSPHYLAYFNEFVGGPDNGYKYLVDSNLDWGQDLKNLKKYMDARSIREIYLSYFGTADPAYYGIRFREVPDVPPAPTAAPAYYAISATSLQNVYAPQSASPHWLARYQPVDKVGYSIFIYQLP